MKSPGMRSRRDEKSWDEVSWDEMSWDEKSWDEMVWDEKSYFRHANPRKHVTCRDGKTGWKGV